jgi:hypothetical protein
MKIRDIISEAYRGGRGHLKDYGSTKGEIDPSLPNARIEPRLRNTDTYMQMRYGVAVAAASAAQGGEQFQQESTWAENLGTLAYTDAEIAILDAADKLMGVSSVKLTGKSKEKSDVSMTSPVLKTDWKKYEDR